MELVKSEHVVVIHGEPVIGEELVLDPYRELLRPRVSDVGIG
jgi:hypothetical protein